MTRAWFSKNGHAAAVIGFDNSMQKTWISYGKQQQ
jgi:C1A family cysteine protease